MKGKAYEEIVGANLRGDRGEFFTPRNIQNMAILEHIGHDKRGNPIFKRDVHGNEILMTEDKTVVEIDETASGVQTARRAAKRKVLDDETEEVADEFLKWKEQEVLGW